MGKRVKVTDLTKGFINELEMKKTTSLNVEYNKEEDVMILVDKHYHYLNLEEIKFVIQKLQNTSTSLKLTLCCNIKTTDMVKVEEFFHNKFKERKLQGEWFKLTAEDILYIRKCNYPKEIIQEIVFDEVIADE
jgi:uncharacterized protein (UPF0216 family)